jgi:hypothetical protein
VERGRCKIFIASPSRELLDNHLFLPQRPVSLHQTSGTSTNGGSSEVRLRKIRGNEDHTESRRQHRSSAVANSGHFWAESAVHLLAVQTVEAEGDF